MDKKVSTSEQQMFIFYDKDQIDQPVNQTVRTEPSKLTNNFEEIQKQKQQVMQQEIKLKKMQEMEAELLTLQVRH